MATTFAPGQLSTQGILLTGPDSSHLRFDPSTDNTVLAAKRHWSEAHKAPIQHIQLLRDNKVLSQDALLKAGEEIKVSYDLAGGGSCNCDVKCQVVGSWPSLCACGWCCTHMYIGRCCPILPWLKGQDNCCFDRFWCMNSDCGFHKIWKCELFCLACDMGGDKHCCDVHGPKCDDCNTNFPSCCRCGLCCSHCWWDRFCCAYFDNIFRVNCCDSEVLCCNSHCGLAHLGNCELLCLQGWCFHCGSPNFRSHSYISSGGWCQHHVTHGGSGGGGSHTTTTTTVTTTHRSTRH